MLDRDLRLARLTGGRHAAQISGACGAPPRQANRQRRCCRGGDRASRPERERRRRVSHLLQESPPLRSAEDRQAMVEALGDGTIDVVCSAHDPQDVERKRQPFAEAADGPVGLETMLAVVLRLMHSGEVPLLRLIEAMSTAPAKLLGLDVGTLGPTAPADLILVDLDLPWIVREEDLHSRSQNTAFEGARLSGKVLRTLVAGSEVYRYA